MKKQTRYILIAVIFIVIVIVGLWWFFGARQTQDGEPRSPFDFFAFPGAQEGDGGISGEGQDSSGGSQKGSDTPLPALRQITDAPVAGFVSFIAEKEGLSGNTSTSTVVRYVEKETGHIKEVGVLDMDKQRITNTTIPRVYSGTWFDGGDRVVLRYLADDGQTVKTFSAKTPNGDELATSTTLTGTFLPDNIREIAINPSQKGVTYLRVVNGEARFVDASPDGIDRSIFFTSPFTEWLPQYARNGALFVVTKPSGVARGYMYEVGRADGSLERMLGGVPGLTAEVSPAGTQALISLSTEGGFQNIIFDIAAQTAESFPVATLPEKCAWSDDALYCGVPKKIPQATYPDSWYQGVQSFNDAIWKVNATTGTSTKLADPQNRVSREMDIVKPSLGPNERYFFFMNKKDSTLWLLDLE